jgi:Excisionase-like protein
MPGAPRGSDDLGRGNNVRSWRARRYTLKQACQVLSVDSKTLHRWMRELTITPVADVSDGRVRLITEDAIIRLSNHARQRTTVSGVPKSDTPLGGYIRTVKHIEEELEEVRKNIGVQAVVLRKFGVAQSAYADALKGWTELIKQGSQNGNVHATASDEQQGEASMNEKSDIDRLEAQLGLSLERFVGLALALESVIANIDRAKALEAEGLDLLDKNSM